MSIPVWKGVLTYGDRAIGIRMFTGPRRESPASFNQLHCCGSRVKQVLHCAAAACPKKDKPVARDEIQSGYEYSDGKYIVIAPADLDRATSFLAHAHDMPVRFVRLADVDPLLYDDGFYVHPAAAEDEPAYIGVANELARAGLAALGRIVLQHRERFILIRPSAGALVAHSLFYPHEARRLSAFRPDPAVKPVPDPLIRKTAETFSFDTLEDRHRAAVQALIAEKVAVATLRKPPARAECASGTQLPRRRKK